MRYLYELRKLSERRFINLREREHDIKQSLIEFIENEIRGVLEEFSIEKDGNIVINKDSFEFSFPGCLQKKSLQRMGKILARMLYPTHGFIRKNNKALVFVSQEKETEEEEQILLEFIDLSICNINNENFASEDSDWVQFYRNLEISVSHISLKKAKKIFGKIIDELEKKEEIIFEVEFRHRFIVYREEDSNDNFNKTIGEYSCFIEHLYSVGLYQPEIIDFVDIKSVNEILNEKDVRQKFDKMKYAALNSNMSKADCKIKDSIETFLDNYRKEGNKSEKYLFTVHNVGQALAISIQIKDLDEDRVPFVYFDYGIACRQNKITLPSNINLPINNKTLIFLSHIHEDHWCGFRKNKEALKATWIIPQTPSKSLLKVLSNVCMNNGRFLLLNTSGMNIVFKWTLNNICIKGGNNDVKSKDLHETGISFMIESNKEGIGHRILISGDQKYDNHIPDFLLNINVLVASHHGGTYGSLGSIPTSNSEMNNVVYSYGKGNTYRHPSKVKEYKNKSWKKEHHTIDGDYTIVIG